jgi:hypothetical protein
MLGMSVICLIVAQTRAPEVIAPAGNIDQTSTISFEWTLGQLATQTTQTEQIMLTEGFHQPLLKIEAIPNLSASPKADLFQVFPNPVKSILEVVLKSDMIEEQVSLILLDMDGQQVFSQTLPEHQGTQEINMQYFAAGAYILQCLNQDGLLLKSFKVIKTK